MKHIIVLVGEIGSGKGTVAAYLQLQYKASYHRFSTMLRDVAQRLYLPISRDILITISEIVREHFGEDTLAKVIAHDVDNDTCSLVVVDGARRMADIEHLSQLAGFHLVYITASLETRFERVRNRGEKVDEQNLTLDQFKKDNERTTEVSIREVAAHTEYTIDNNGTREELHTHVDTLMAKLGVAIST